MLAAKVILFLIGLTVLISAIISLIMANKCNGKLGTLKTCNYTLIALSLAICTIFGYSSYLEFYDLEIRELISEDLLPILVFVCGLILFQVAIIQYSVINDCENCSEDLASQDSIRNLYIVFGSLGVVMILFGILMYRQLI
jgi:hypothetical protein